MITANTSLLNEMTKIRALNKLLQSDASIYVNYLKIQQSLLNGIQNKIRNISKDSKDGLNRTGNQFIQLLSLMRQGSSDLKKDLSRISQPLISGGKVGLSIFGKVLGKSFAVLGKGVFIFAKLIGRGALFGIRLAAGGIIQAFKFIGKGIIGALSLAGKGAFQILKFIGSGIAGVVKTFAGGIQKIPGLLQKIPIKTFAEQAQGMQELQKRIAGLPQKFCDSAEGLEFLARQANRARKPIVEYSEAYISLAKSTKSFVKSPIEVSDALNAMSNALTLGTGNTEQQESALSELVEGFKKGALGSEELSGFLKLLSEGDLKKLESSMGLGCDSLLKLAEEGKITGEQLIKSMRGLGPGWQEQVNNMPLTLAQVTDKISNRWQVFLFRLEAKTGIISKITQLFLDAFQFIEKKVYEFIDEFGGAEAILNSFVDLFLKGFGYIQKVLNWFIKYCGGVKQALTTLGIVFGGLGIASFIAALTPILVPLGLIIGALLLVGKVVKDVFAWINGEQSVLGNFFGPWAEFAPKIIASWEAFSTRMAAIWDTVKLIASNGWNYFSNLINAISPSLNLMWDGVKNIFSGAIDIISGLWDILVGIFTVDPALIIGGFSSLFTGIFNLFVGIIDSVMGLIQGIYIGLKHIVDGALDSLWNVIKGWIAKIPGAQTLLGADFGSTDSNAENIPKEPSKELLANLSGFANFGNEVKGITPAMAANSSSVVNNQQTSNNQITISVAAGTPKDQVDSIAQAVKNAMAKSSPEKQMINSVNGGTT